MRLYPIFSALAVAGLLTGCSELPGVQYLSRISFLSPYKMDIRQGNYFDDAMLDKLKTGMTRDQVQFIMGTPLVSDAFDKNRWDYVYTYQHAGKLIANRHVVVYFDQDKVNRIDRSQDYPPVAASVPAPAAPAQPPAVSPAVAPVPAAPAAKG